MSSLTSGQFWAVVVVGWFLLSVVVGIVMGRFLRGRSSDYRMAFDVHDDQRRIAANGDRQRQGRR